MEFRHKEVVWLPGTDHAGIATQVQVEKALKKEEKKTKHDLGREEFLKRVWQWKEKHGGIIIQQLKKLGCSCDWTRERFTMDPEYSRCVQKVFVELYKKGLIYRGKRMVNWCPATQTALSDEEVEMKPQKGFMYYFKVEVAEAVPGSGRVPGIAPRHPPTPPDVRFSASGGWTRPRSSFAGPQNFGRQATQDACGSFPAPASLGQSGMVTAVVASRCFGLPSRSQFQVAAWRRLVLRPFARNAFSFVRSSNATMASADSPGPLSPRVSPGQGLFFPFAPLGSTECRQ